MTHTLRFYVLPMQEGEFCVGRAGPVAGHIAELFLNPVVRHSPNQVRHSVNATHGYHTVRHQLRLLVLQPRTERAQN